MKKLLMVLPFLVSTTVLASSSTVTRLDQPTFIPKNRTMTFYSHHEYHVTNDSESVQSFNVCFTMTSCPEWQYYVKSTKTCTTLQLSPHQAVNDRRDMTLNVNYPFTGWCHLVATTEVNNAVSSQDTKQFQVG